MGMGLEAPEDWGFSGYENYSTPESSYIPSSDWWSDLGTGIDPNQSSYGFDFGANYLPIDQGSYLQEYTLPYGGLEQPPGVWDSLTSGNWGQAAESLYDQLGGAKGVFSAGLGGLSMLGNYLANKDQVKTAKDQFNRTLALRQEDLDSTRNTDLAKVEALMNILGQRGRVQLDPRRYAEIVASGQLPVDQLASQERIDIRQPMKMARGGLGLLAGGTPGQSDKINARLSHGEYIFDADTVSALGDGNTEAGAAALDQMREEIRRHKRSASPKKIPPPARSPMQYLKGGNK